MISRKHSSTAAFVLVLGLTAIGARPAALAGDDKPDEVSFRFGQMVMARFYLRNTEKETIHVGFPRLINHHYYHSLRFLDKDGQPASIHQKDDPGVPVGWLAVQLGSGQSAETSGGWLSIGEGLDKDAAETILSAKSGGTYSVQYTLPNYGDAKAADLHTGEFRFRILEHGTAAAKQPSAEKLKKQIAWGKPGKNGLQIGVVLASEPPLSAPSQPRNP